LRLAQLRYDGEGRLCWPHREERAGEEALAEHLAYARALFAALPDEPAVDGNAGQDISPHFEELRWFELPDVCLSAPRA
jgi:hypothetical protein